MDAEDKNLGTRDEGLEKIKICRVITRLNIGGPAQHVILLTSGLPRERFETLLVAGREEKGEGSLLDLAVQQEARLLLIPELGRAVRPLRDLRAFLKLERLFCRWRPHIVHTHTSKAGALGRLAAWLARVPIIIHTFHGHVFDGYFPSWKARAFLLIEQGLASITTLAIALSEGQRQELLRLKLSDPEKLTIQPLGLELGRFLDCRAKRGELRRELGLPEEEKVVGIVGRLVPIKGHAVFLRAARLVLEKLPSCRFLIVGDGFLRPQLEQLARGLSRNVYFLGWRSDLPRIYADLDLLVLSSLNEGTPVSVIEAMAAGLPIAASAVGGVKDLIIHGKTGLLVEPGDPEALSGAIMALLEQPQRAEAMGKAAQKVVYPDYDVGSLLGRMQGLYETLVQSKLGGRV